MTREKTLFFFNLHDKIDKSTMGIILGCDITYTVITISILLLFKIITLTSITTCVILSAMIATDILFFIWYKLSHNPASEISYTATVLGTSTVKLMYCAIMFSKFMIFQFEYIVAFIVSILLSKFRIREYTSVYEYIKNHSIEQTQEMIQNKKTNKIIFPVIAIAAISIALFQVITDPLDIEQLGLLIWCLACIWLHLFITSTYKFILSKKHKAAKVIYDIEE